MQKRVGAVVLAAGVWCGAAWAGDAPRGARALFYDDSSGATVATRATTVRKATRKEAPKVTPTGLKYYLEQLRANGELLRVNANKVFYSGERFRLKVESNVGGRLAVVQSQDGGRAERLFPDMRIRGGDDHIKAHVVTALPSDRGWFRFDDRPGEVRLLVMVTPEPAPQRRSPDTMAADAVRLEELDGLVQAMAKSQARGSRGLVVEDDYSADAAATYAVSSGSAGTGGALTIEIRLKHRR